MNNLLVAAFDFAKIFGNIGKKWYYYLALAVVIAIVIVVTLLQKNRRNNLRIDFKSSCWEKKANGTVIELKIGVIEVNTFKIPSIRKHYLKIQYKSVSQRFPPGCM